MKYDVSYNMTEEVRNLLDADYKKDLVLFETAKKHILLLLSKPDVDMTEYTELKKKVVDEFFKQLQERLKQEKNENTMMQITSDLEYFSNAYNAVTLKYMNDTLVFLMDYVNRK